MGMTFEIGTSLIGTIHVKKYEQIKKLPPSIILPTSLKRLSKYSVGDSFSYYINGGIGVSAGVGIGYNIAPLIGAGVSAGVSYVLQVKWHLDYGIFALVPFLVAILFRYGQRLIFTVQVAVLSLAVIATWSGSGPFVAATTWESLIQLQSFAAAFSIILFLVAILNLEKSSNEAYLEKRTKELEELYRKDALTGLWNRYRIKEFLQLELERLKNKQILCQQRLLGRRHRHPAPIEKQCILA